MIDWIVNVHPYLAYIIFLLLWCAIGYLEVRFVSPLMGCGTWLFATVATSLAVFRIPGLILPGWLLGLLILTGGSTTVLWIYRVETRKRPSNAEPAIK